MATIEFDLAVYDTTALAKVIVPAFSLPSGFTWRTVVTISGTPSSKMPKPLIYKQNGANFSGTTQTFRVLRPLDSNGKVHCNVSAQRQKGGTWETYDTLVISTSSITVPKAPPPRNPLPAFGVNVHVFIPQLRPAGSLAPMLDKMAGTPNVSLVRASAPWQYVQPNPGTWDAGAVERMNAFAEWLRANNCKWVLAMPAVAPIWGTSTGQVGYPSNMNDYVGYINGLLDRYGDVIGVVENANEPNTNHPLVGNYGFTFNNFVTSQQVMYDTVKAYNSDIKVTTPAIAYGDAPYLQTLYDYGMRPYFDLVDIHPYDYRFDMVGTAGPDGNANGVACDTEVGWPDEAGRMYSPTHGVQYIYETMYKNGDGGKQILVGEWGLSTSFTGINRTKSTLDVTQAQQAARTRAAMRQVSRDPRVYAFLVYMLYDNPYNAAGETPYDLTKWQIGFGMMTPDAKYVKPAFTEFLDRAAHPA